MTPELWSHPEWRTLLRAIRLAPADDQPRLVAADWLEEQRLEACAVFIRRQIEGEVASVPLSFIDPVIEKLLGVQPHQAFRTAVKGMAIIGSGPDIKPGVSSVTYARGFVHAIECRLAEITGGAVPCNCGVTPEADDDFWSSRPFKIRPGSACQRCKGTGVYWIKGCGRDLGYHPVQNFMLASSEPSSVLRQTDNLSTVSFYWPLTASVRQVLDPFWTPAELWDRKEITHRQQPIRFETRADASIALVTALKDWLRKRPCYQCSGGRNPKFITERQVRKFVDQKLPTPWYQSICEVCNGSTEIDL